MVAAKGMAQVEPLLTKVAETDMPQAAKETLAHLGRVVTQLDAQLAEFDQRLAKQQRPTRSANAWPRSPASDRSRR